MYLSLFFYWLAFGTVFYTYLRSAGQDIEWTTAVGGYDEPIFVIGIDTKSNEIFVGKGKNHPGLIKKAIQIDMRGKN